MRVVSLGSGSSGNTLLVEAGPQGRSRLLVDAGLSARLIISRLRSVGVHPAQIQGVLVTHEHSDHVLALPVLMKRYAIPIVADPRTYTAIENGINAGIWRSDSGKLVEINDPSTPLLEETSPSMLVTAQSTDDGNEQQINMLEHNSDTQKMPAISTIALPVGSGCVLGDIEVTSFPISHDAIAPCGYLLRAGGCRICIVTDSGEVTPTMLEHIQHADLLILEANHDRARLLRGPYPYHLKQRILSSTGHLSNDQTAEAVLRTWRSDGVRWLWLAHLSRTNNTPSLALESIRRSLQTAKVNLAHIHISALPPGMGYVWDSTRLWHQSSLWEMDY